MKHLIPVESHVTFDQLVLFENFRKWIDPLVPAIREANHLSPRGVLLVGMPGTGKGSCVQATATLLNRPVLRLAPDVDNVRSILKELGDKPVILWLDEPGKHAIELLRCLSLEPELASRVFVMATSSKPHLMAAKLAHSTWFDRVFYHDLPCLHGRALLWKLMITRVGGDATNYDSVILSRASSLFTPAEIESVARQAHTGIDKAPEEKHILDEITRRKPCALSLDEELARLRNWASRYAEWIWKP